ncbi:hypothetical protein F5B17DRAFT_407408 [Nemania serpens]|nr:hypothetical protein F5B17DRAFT_407408 [Nemania serpens]
MSKAVGQSSPRKDLLATSCVLLFFLLSALVIWVYDYSCTIDRPTCMITKTKNFCICYLLLFIVMAIVIAIVIAII